MVATTHGVHEAQILRKMADTEEATRPSHRREKSLKAEKASIRRGSLANTFKGFNAEAWIDSSTSADIVVEEASTTLPAPP